MLLNCIHSRDILGPTPLTVVGRSFDTSQLFLSWSKRCVCELGIILRLFDLLFLHYFCLVTS